MICLSEVYHFLSTFLTDHAVAARQLHRGREHGPWASWADAPSPLVCLSRGLSRASCSFLRPLLPINELPLPSSVSLARPFLSCAHYFQAPATRAINAENEYAVVYWKTQRTETDS